MFCRGPLDFRMNKNSLRFLASHLYGYWTDNVLSSNEFPEGEGTPYMEIGKCSPF